MKYIVVLGDGMADRPVENLGNHTPLEIADKPNIDRLATRGICGVVKTVPDRMKPGSDVANLAVMGYNPEEYYTGRAPLEALSIGVKMLPTDVAIRCNLVTLSDEENYADKTMIDYSAGEISTEEAAELIKSVQEGLGDEIFSFYSGVSYRHCLIVHFGNTSTEFTPPHDITGRKITEYLPDNKIFLALQEKSYEILKDHPINLKRIEAGKNPANSIWLWGAGTSPQLKPFEEMFALKGAVISAVDLLKGIGIAADMQVIDVEGATGRLDTNFMGKAEACVNALNNGADYVYLHMEAPDECGHQGDADGKVRAIEKVDEVVGYLLEKLEGEDFRMLITPDHPTPLSIRTHCADRVPFVIYDSREDSDKYNIDRYDEKNCADTGLVFESGDELVAEFIFKAMTGNKFYGAGDVEAEEDSAEREENEQFPVMQDADNEIATDTDGAGKDKKKRRKKEKKNRELTPEDKKKRKKIAIICISAILIIAVLITAIVTPIVVLNRGKIFVGKADDFAKTDGDYYVLSRDLEIDGDLKHIITKPLDLAGHTLTVNGKMTVGESQNNETVKIIGTKKKDAYGDGGTLIVKELAVACRNFEIYSSVTADKVVIESEDAKINGGMQINGSLEVTGGRASFSETLAFSAAAKMVVTDAIVSVNGNAKTEINLTTSVLYVGARAEVNTVRADAQSEARIYGKTSEGIYGGRLIVVTATAETGGIYYPDELWVSKSNLDMGEIVLGSGEIKYITELSRPYDLSIEDVDGKIYCRVAEVNGAARYAFSIDGAEEIITDTPYLDVTEYIIPFAGEHTVAVRALGEEGADIDLVVPSEQTMITYENKRKLETPSNLQILKDEESGAITLTFDAVNYADEYVININGREITSRETVVDITEYVSAVGGYAIRVQARSAKNPSMIPSSEALISYTATEKLATPVITEFTAEDNKLILGLQAERARLIEISVTDREGNTVVYVVAYSENIVMDCNGVREDSTVTVRAIGYDYYEDSDAWHNRQAAYR